MSIGVKKLCGSHYMIQWDYLVVCTCIGKNNGKHLSLCHFGSLEIAIGTAMAVKELSPL